MKIAIKIGVRAAMRGSMEYMIVISMYKKKIITLEKKSKNKCRKNMCKTLSIVKGK
jgi:hypothetical protein